MDTLGKYYLLVTVDIILSPLLEKKASSGSFEKTGAADGWAVSPEVAWGRV